MQEGRITLLDYHTDYHFLKKEKRFKYLFLYKKNPQCIYLRSAYAKARMCDFVPDSAVSHIQIHSRVT